VKKKLPAVSFSELERQFVEIGAFLNDATEAGLSGSHITRCFDHGVIWAYRVFEEFVLDIAVAQINRDPSIFYDNMGVEFGRHPTVAQCAYLLTGDRFFDFRGHRGLVEVARKVAGAKGALTEVVKAEAHRQSFEILAGLRNYAAHQSDQSRGAALKAMQHWQPNRHNLGLAGSWLRVKNAGDTRMTRLLNGIQALGQEMRDAVT
jgi:hypothetical protein